MDVTNVILVDLLNQWITLQWLSILLILDQVQFTLGLKLRSLSWWPQHGFKSTELHHSSYALQILCGTSRYAGIGEGGLGRYAGRMRPSIHSVLHKVFPMQRMQYIAWDHYTECSTQSISRSQSNTQAVTFLPSLHSEWMGNWRYRQENKRHCKQLGNNFVCWNGNYTLRYSKYFGACKFPEGSKEVKGWGPGLLTTQNG